LNIATMREYEIEEALVKGEFQRILESIQGLAAQELGYGLRTRLYQAYENVLRTDRVGVTRDWVRRMWLHVANVRAELRRANKQMADRFFDLEGKVAARMYDCIAEDAERSVAQ
jgi:hypothetical protein